MDLSSVDHNYSPRSDRMHDKLPVVVKERLQSFCCRIDGTRLDTARTCFDEVESAEICGPNLYLVYNLFLSSLNLCLVSYVYILKSMESNVSSLKKRFVC